MRLKLRFPRLVLFTISAALFVSIALSFFNRGVLDYSLFSNKVSYFSSLVASILLTMISFRSVFYCTQVTCGAVYIVVLGIFYKLFPAILQNVAVIAFFVAIWVIVTTALHDTKTKKEQV